MNRESFPQGPVEVERVSDLTNLRPVSASLSAASAGGYNRNLIEASLDPLVTIGPDGKITDVNAATEAVTGRTRRELIGTDFCTYFTDPAKARAGYEEAFRCGAVRDYALELRHQDGTVTPVLYNASTYRDESGAVAGVFAAARDVRALRQTQAELSRANRALRAISTCNQAIIHAEDEGQLLQQVCRAMVDVAGFRLAWIGYREDDEQKTVRPVASAGHDDGYVTSTHITWADTERGRGPTGRTIRSGRPAICRDMLADPGFAPWREAAMKRGFASSIVLPLMKEADAFGALSLYAADPDVFDDSEAQLLSELAEDLAFGILSLRERAERRRAEAALEESERSFRTLAESVPQMVWSARADGWHVYFNQRWVAYTGLSAAESCGAGWMTRLHPDDQPRAANTWAKAMEQGAPTSMELRIRRADEIYRWWLVRGVPVHDATGRIIKWFGTCTDIDDLKLAHEQIRLLNVELEKRVDDRTRELKERMAELQTIIDTSPIGLAIAKDVSCRHIRGNQPLERMLGIQTGGEVSLEGPGPKAYRVLADGRELAPEELPMQRAARGETVVGQHFDTITGDGRMIHLYSSATPLHDEEGRVRGVIGAFLDITDLKHTEAALRLSEARFRDIYDTAPVSIWQEDWTDVIAATAELRTMGVTDFAGYFRKHPEFVARALEAVKILDVNAYTVDMFGARDKAELLASLSTVFNTAETLPGFINELVALAEGRSVYRTEMTLNRVRGGEIRALLAMTFPPAGAETNRVLVSVVDITERKRAEEQIRALNENLRLQTAQLATANHELEAFAYSVSHDLRAPLRAIDGFSRILVREQLDKLGEKGCEDLQRIRTATQRMGVLIDDLLKLSRMARTEFHRRPIDLALIARSVIAELEAAEPDRRVTWVVASDLHARGDPTLLRAALENLLGNAWKFTSRRADARVEFAVTEREGERVFHVRDNGAGFDMQYAGKLFGPFQRLHTQSEFPGTGIGLATVQRIIHRHAGRVWAEAAVDAGATFYFTLPDTASSL